MWLVWERRDVDSERREVVRKMETGDRRGGGWDANHAIIMVRSFVS